MSGRPLDAAVAEQLDGLENQVLVHIAVTKDELGNYKLDVYPQRGEDATIYYVSDENRKKGNYSPAKPWEVRWVVSGLQTRQQIVISEKTTNKAKRLLPSSPHVVTAPGGTALSGRAKRSPGGKPNVLYWTYDIRLMQLGKQTPLAHKDPEIPVKDDP
jgi:hypothetical protein